MKKLTGIFLCIICLYILNARAQIYPKFDFAFSGYDRDTIFNTASDIYLDEENQELYILDNSSKTVFIVKINGVLIYKFKVKTKRNLRAITVDSKGNIYIATWDNKIKIYNYKGEFIKDLKIDNVNSISPKKLIFKKFKISPFQGKARWKKEFIFILDDSKNSIICTDFDGNFYFEKKLYGTVYGFDIDNEGKIYAVNRTAYTIDIYNAAGDKEKSFGRPGQSAGAFSIISNISVSEYKKQLFIFVVDSTKQAIHIFDKNGNFEKIIYTNSPTGLAVNHNEIFIASSSLGIMVYMF